MDKKHSASKPLIAGTKCMAVEFKNKKDSSNQRQRRDNKKSGLLDSMATHPAGLSVEEQDLQNYDGVLYDFAPSSLHLYNNTENGFVHWLDKEKGIASCILVPQAILNHKASKKTSDKVVEALLVLQKTEKHCRRGKNQTGLSFSKYTIYGWQVLQAKGYSQSAVEAFNPEASATLKGFAKRLEDLASLVLPSSWLRAMKAAADLLDVKTVGGCTFGASIASSIDDNSVMLVYCTKNRMKHIPIKSNLVFCTSSFQRRKSGSRNQWP